MTTADVSEILAKLGAVLERLARIEERTSVLTDHETRIRAAEEAARVAGDTATRAAGVAEAQAVRIRTLEDNDRVSGRFSWGDVTKVIMAAAALSAIVGVVYSIFGG